MLQMKKRLCVCVCVALPDDPLPKVFASTYGPTCSSAVLVLDDFDLDSLPRSAELRLVECVLC